MSREQAHRREHRSSVRHRAYLYSNPTHNNTSTMSPSNRSTTPSLVSPVCKAVLLPLAEVRFAVLRLLYH